MVVVILPVTGLQHVLHGADKIRVGLWRMHQHFSSRGFTSLISACSESSPYRCCSTIWDSTSFRCGTARMSRRRLRTGQRNQLRFPVQFPRLAVHLLARLKRRPDPFQHALLAHTLHRRPTHAKNRCDVRIRQPPAATPVFIRKKKNVRVPALFRRRVAPHKRCRSVRTPPKETPGAVSCLSVPQPASYCLSRSSGKGSAEQ